MPDQNQHGCKKKDRIIRGIIRIGQQNRKEEKGLKHKLLRFIWWITLHFFMFSVTKLNFVDLLMKIDWVLTYCSQLWGLAGPLVLLDMLCLFYLEYPVNLICLQLTSSMDFSKLIINVIHILCFQYELSASIWNLNYSVSLLLKRSLLSFVSNACSSCMNVL